MICYGTRSRSHPLFGLYLLYLKKSFGKDKGRKGEREARGMPVFGVVLGGEPGFCGVNLEIYLSFHYTPKRAEKTVYQISEVGSDFGGDRSLNLKPLSKHTIKDFASRCMGS